MSEHDGNDIFEDKIHRQKIYNQRLENIKSRTNRDQKFLHFVVRLLTQEHIFSGYQRHNQTHFLYIDKVTSPIYQETKDNLLKILSLGLIRYFFIDMKCIQKHPFPKRTQNTDSIQVDLDIEYLDIWDCPPLQFSDLSLDLLTSLFNNQSINPFIMKEQRSNGYQKWNSCCNGDLLLMFRIQQILQKKSSFNLKNLIFKDPISLYVDGNHAVYREQKRLWLNRQEMQDRLEKQQTMEAQRQRDFNLSLFHFFQNPLQQHIHEPVPNDSEPSKDLSHMYDDNQLAYQKYLLEASKRLFEDDIRPFLMHIVPKFTFVPQIEDILYYPIMGFSHPLLRQWSKTPNQQKDPHHMLPLLQTYHALFIDTEFTEKLIHQFSKINNSGLRMQNIQRHRRELAASLDVFRCLEEQYQRIVYEPVFNRTAAEKIFLQQCEQYEFRKTLLVNHQHCCESLCSVLS